MPDKTITARNARYRRRLRADRDWRRVEVFVPADRVEALRAFARDLRRSHAPPPRAEEVNDRVKLLYHRLVARRLRHDPTLIDQARKVVAEWLAVGNAPGYVRVWQAWLERPLSELSGMLISRSPEATRLRLSSPFPFVQALRIDDERARRRLWRVGKRRFVRSTTFDAPRVR